MSILIEGMKMPTDGIKNIMIFADGRVFQFSGYGNPKPLGTAVPIPEPHGRLIDADALHNAIAANIIGSRCGEETSVEIAISEEIIDDLMIIDAQQTVIPASKEG